MRKFVSFTALFLSLAPQSTGGARKGRHAGWIIKAIGLIWLLVAEQQRQGGWVEKTALLRQRRTTLRTVKLATETLLIGFFGSSVVTGLIMLFFFPTLVS